MLWSKNHIIALVIIGVVLMAIGFLLIFGALGFKIGAVPFHSWIPDTYHGSPTPVTAFLSVGSKAAGFVVLLRVLQPFAILPQTQRLIVLLAMLTLIYGNLAALPQSNLKRLLAYSSIGHAGFLLLAILLWTSAVLGIGVVATAPRQIAAMAVVPTTLVVRPGTFKTLAELVAAAHERIDVLERGQGIGPDQPREPAHVLAADRVSLVRHGTRALLALRERLLDLQDLGALERADLGGHLLERRGRDGQRGRELGVPVPLHDLCGKRGRL